MCCGDGQRAVCVVVVCCGDSQRTVCVVVTVRGLCVLW